MSCTWARGLYSMQTEDRGRFTRVIVSLAVPGAEPRAVLAAAPPALASSHRGQGLTMEQPPRQRARPPAARPRNAGLARVQAGVGLCGGMSSSVLSLMRLCALPDQAAVLPAALLLAAAPSGLSDT